ncbi:Tetraacyldisaccharide 4'-kinase [Candidatus Ecksteinia adelgidicola]|nr:Tetraacyldisaccharide 4'-kinase [Candidatus Ecksteinia adelgidicola]
MINYIWSGRYFIYLILLPFSFLYGLISILIRFSYHFGLLKSWKAPVPIVIVGNINAGGQGKTPMVIWLVNQLQQRGYQVGVISRGYGGRCQNYPILLHKNTSPFQAGDEPVLIYQRTKAPLSVSPKRSEAVKKLLKTFKIDIIISDDGLQHYALQRDFEIIIIDGVRRFGNGWWLPAGPMRERASRIKTVNACIINGGTPKSGEISMTLYAHEAINMLNGQRLPVNKLTHVVAMAGIGYPPRFFEMLKKLDCFIEKEISFSDHKFYQLTSLMMLTLEGQTLLMTEKDAVKCYNFAQPHWWYLPIDAIFSSKKEKKLLQKIENLLIH